MLMGKQQAKSACEKSCCAYLRQAKQVLASFILAIITIPSVSAADKSVTIKDAISRTLNQHPELASFSYQQQAAQGLIKQAQQGTATQVALELEDGFGSGSYRGLSSLQTSLSIAWLLEDEVIESRYNLANSKVSKTQLNRDIKALDLAAETANIFITLLAQQQQLKLAKLAQQQSQQVLADIKKRVAVGKLNLIDQLRSQADLSKKALVVEDLIHEIAASKAQLAAQWNSSEQDFQVLGSLAQLPKPIALDAHKQQLRTNPRLKLFASEQRIAASAIALSKATAAPSWQVKAGIKRNEALDDFAFTAGISIPLTTAKRNQGEIMALKAKQQQVQAKANAWYQRMSTQLLLLSHKLGHNRHVVDALTEQTIPALEQANVEAQKAYQTGNYSYSDWYLIQQELIDSQFALIEAYSNIHRFNIELERLTGAALVD